MLHGRAAAPAAASAFNADRSVAPAGTWPARRLELHHPASPPRRSRPRCRDASGDDGTGHHRAGTPQRSTLGLGPTNLSAASTGGPSRPHPSSRRGRLLARAVIRLRLVTPSSERPVPLEWPLRPLRHTRAVSHGATSTIERVSDGVGTRWDGGATRVGVGAHSSGGGRPLTRPRGRGGRSPSGGEAEALCADRGSTRPSATSESRQRMTCTGSSAESSSRASGSAAWASRRRRSSSPRTCRSVPCQACPRRGGPS